LGAPPLAMAAWPARPDEPRRSPGCQTCHVLMRGAMTEHVAEPAACGAPVAVERVVVRVEVLEGAATVANDVVFTSTYDDTIYALDTKSGTTLWTTKARAGLNSFPAIDGDTLLVGAGTTGFFKKPRLELVAYTLGSSRTRPSAPAGAATTIRVRGEEFGFRLSRMRSAGSRAAQA
jgi:hypothetical protein